MTESKNLQQLKNETGVFVMVKRGYEGADKYLLFKYRSNFLQLSLPGYHLAIFNNFEYANWFGLNQLDKVDIKYTFSALGGDEDAMLKVPDQRRWDYVRESALAESDGQYAIINPCIRNKEHQCPVVSLNLNECTDFNKVKKILAKHPKTHIEIDI